MSFLLCPKYIGSRGIGFEINNTSAPSNQAFYTVGGIDYKSVWWEGTGNIEITDDILVNYLTEVGLQVKNVDFSFVL